jgi:nitrate reductase gamma subunit
MIVLLSLVLVVALFGIGMLGASGPMGWAFGVVIPYAAAALFLVGLIYRVLTWANVPVPFRIPTTCGQQKALSWIKPQRLENPPNGLAAIGRMALEVFLFRSLLRNTRAQLAEGRKLIYTTDIWLWLGAMAMHWAFLIILIRHLRFVTNPVPGWVVFLERADGFFEIGLPVVFATTVIFIVAVGYLLLRRLASPQLRYISLVGDYFPLFLLLGIGISGAWMRHLEKTDVAAVKELALGLASFAPAAPADSISPIFYGHLFLFSVLVAYFPFSKLVHAPGVLLSPTRNLANSNRRVRHVNPWDYPVKVHTYEEYEDELREKMVGAGLPVERQ